MSAAYASTSMMVVSSRVASRSAAIRRSRLWSNRARPQKLRDTIRVQAAASDSPPMPPPRGRVSARWLIDTRYGHKAAALALLDTWVHTVGVDAGLDPQRVSLFTGQLGCPESRVEMHCEQFDDLSLLDNFFNSINGAKHKQWGEQFQEHVMDGSPTWHVLRSVALSGGAGSVDRTSDDANEKKNKPKGKMKKNPATLSFVEDAADVAAAVAAAAAFDVTYNGGSDFTLGDEASGDDLSNQPPRTKPRTPKSLSKEQLDMPVFSADDFGDSEGLVFPSSNDDDDSSDTESSLSATFGIDLSEYEPGSKVVMDWKGDPMVITPGDKLPNVQ